MTAEPVAAVEGQLTARQGKVLRYLVSTRTQPVTPLMCVVEISWSDLPKTFMQARKTLEELRKLKLVERVGKQQYSATQAGKDALAQADKERQWRKAPSPQVTNQFLHREKQ